MLKSHLNVPLLVLLSIAVYSQGSAGAPVYKSKDAEGNVTYSSEPPEDATKVKEVAVPTSPSSGGDSVDDIQKKADALEEENLAREKEIKENKESKQTSTEVVVEDQPVYQHRPVIQNRPIAKPPTATPLPQGGAAKGAK
ncbi:DUF4124 domain-containing protein [Kaarinaea lacus]